MAEREINVKITSTIEPAAGVADLKSGDTLPNLFGQIQTNLSALENREVILTKAEQKELKEKGQIQEGVTYFIEDDSDDEIWDRISNPNLIINPDFRIWQRYPKKVYEGIPHNTYIADRFTLTSSSATVSTKFEAVSGGGIKNVSGVGCPLRYKLENAASLNGKTVTVSALKDANCYSKTFVPSDWDDTTDVLNELNHAVDYGGWILPGETIYRVKLELGDKQTLAHKDSDGNWVLNDPPPNPATELAKCQRYYYRAGFDDASLLTGTFGKSGETSTYVTSIRFPTTMRISPEVTVYDGFQKKVGNVWFSAKGQIPINITDKSKDEVWIGTTEEYVNGKVGMIALEANAEV